MTKLKTIMIITSIVLFVLALFLIGTFSFSTINQEDINTAEIDTGIACAVNSDCSNNPDLPSFAYCYEMSCRFTDTADLMVVFDE